MTPGEHRIIDQLAYCWNEFIALEKLHIDEANEFRTALHNCQVIIMARETARNNPDVFNILKQKV